MRILSKLKKGVSNFKKNISLGSQTAKIAVRNRTGLKTGDSLVALKTRRLIRESTIPKPIKKRMDKKLTKIIHNHLRGGKMWVDFREQVYLREKKEGRKLTEIEKEEMWHQWNKDQDGY